MNERRPTSTDVAQRAGVSRSTVSYVLNDRTDRHLPEATRKKVLDAARELGYVPNPSARALRGKLPPVILGLAPALPFGRIVGVVTDTLTDLAQKHGVSLVSMRGGDASALETALVYLQPRLVLSYALPTPEERAVLERFRIPVAPQHDGLPGAESGDPVARMQVRALHGAGRHRLAYLGTVDRSTGPAAPASSEPARRRATTPQRSCACRCPRPPRSSASCGRCCAAGAPWTRPWTVWPATTTCGPRPCCTPHGRRAWPCRATCP